MNFRPKLFVSALLLCSGAALSANENSYYNVVGVAATPTLWMPGMPQMVYDVYLTQDAVTCTDPDWSMKVGTSTYRPSGYGGIAAGGSTGVCYGSAEATPENLYDLVKKYWVDAVNTSNLTLGSDIDLGEMSATDGECKANHKPLPYKSGKTFYGENHKISNLCYVSSTMSESVGFFDAVENTLMQDVVLDGVQIVVHGTVGERVYPVGSLAGSLNLVTLENVKLSNVSIDAPLAGGVAGVVLNSSIIKMSNSGNISISNTQAVTTPPKKVAVGETDYGLVGPYGVLLGGVAGISIRDDRNDTAFTLDDVSLSVRIQNAAEGTRSALGGAIGFVFSSQDKFRNVNVVTGGVAKSASTSRISGGSAMGGLVGYASLLYQNNSPIAVDKSVLKLERSSFAGEIGDASSPDVIAVGGLVGRDSLLAFTKLEIVNSTANISFTDEVKKTGSYRYYAGGILGYGNNCASSNRNTDFVVIEKAKSTGSMMVSASDKAVENLHVDVTMGGIAGAACIAMENRGFKDNSSSVSLTSKVKTTGDSITVGGMIGSIFVADAKGASLTGLNYTGKITVEDSLSESFVGGVLGQFREAEGGRTVTFKNVYVSADGGTLVDYKLLAPADPKLDKPIGTRIGGVCGYCKETGVSEKIGIMGGISVEGGNNYAGDLLYVGGIMGYTHNTSVSLMIEKTFTQGDIMVDAAATSTKVGYLVGYGLATQQKGSYTFRSNYHYSENDNVDAFGFLSDTDAQGDGLGAGWISNENFSYNIRNGLESTYASNDLHNGFATKSEMKTRNFAGELNRVFSSIDDEGYAWCYEAGTYNDLPFVTSKNVTTVSPSNTVDYFVSFYDYDGITLLQTPEKVPEGKSATPPENPVREGYTFVGWDKSFDNVMTDLSIVAEYKINRYWVVFHKEDSTVIYGTNSDESTYPYGAIVEDPDADRYASRLAKEGYTFVGWNDSTHYVGVTQDLYIYPVYKVNKYTLHLLDDEKNPIQSGLVPFGTELSLPESAEKEETEEFSYTFDSWKMADGGEIPTTMPAHDIAVVATFKAEKKSYPVTFLDYDGTPLGDPQMVEYGESATFPVYEDTENKRIYAWSNADVSNITGPKTVTAQVKFKITFKMTEDSVFHEEWITNGFDISFVNDQVLDRDTADGLKYSFIGWEPEIGVVDGPAVYTARYESEPYEIPPSSSSSEQSSSSSVIVVANDMIAGSRLEPSGHAVRLVYSTQKVDPAVKTQVRLVVDGAEGFAVDTVLVDSLTSSSSTGIWETISAPDGNVVAKLYVENQFVVDSSVQKLVLKAEKDVNVWDWKMVSLADVKSEDVDWNGDATFYWWDEQNPIGDYWQYKAFLGGDADPALGYWYGTENGIALTRERAADTRDSLIRWELDSLYSGWNMVANPYGWYVMLDTAAAAKEGIHFWRWDDESSQYKPTDIVGPYEAVWAKSAKKVTWEVSSEPIYDFARKDVPSSGKVAALRKDAARTSLSNWSVVATLKGENGKEDSWNVLGVGAKAETMEKAPMGMGKYVRLAIMDGKSKLAKSVKAVSDRYEWTLKVSASGNSDGELSFDGVDALNQMGLDMYVTVDGKTQKVREGQGVKVALSKTSKEVSVQVVTAAKEMASKVSGFKVNRVGEGLRLGFDAPESLAGTTASYALTDVKGKVVLSGNLRVTGGTNSLDLKNPKSGMYFVQLKLGSQNVSSRILVK